MRKKIISTICLIIMALTLLPTVSAATDYGFLTEITSTSFLPSTIHAGDVVSMALDVHNRGSAIQVVDLTATLDVGNQFEGIELTDSIELIKSDETKTIVFKFRVKENTLPTYYPVFLTLSYLREDKVVSETQSITVAVSKTEKNVDVTIEPRIINPGKQTEIIFSLKNIGGTPISNISFSWEEENDLVLPLGSDNKRYVSLLEPNNSKDVIYTVAADPNITTGIYPLNITVSFTDVNGTRTQTSQVGLLIGGSTDFEVSAEILDSGQISLSIANIGSNNAEAVVVRIPEQQGINISGTNIEILGNLNKGDFTLANFEMARAVQMDAASSQPTNQGIGIRIPGLGGARRPSTNQTNGEESSNGNVSAFNNNLTSNKLLVQIDYTDTTGERQSVEKTVQLSSDRGTAAPSGTFNGAPAGGLGIFSLIPWVLLVLVVGAAVAFNMLKAKRDWKKLGVVLAGIAALFIVAIFLLRSDLIVVLVAAVASIAGLAWFFLKTQDK
ncbi:MAG: hypothetical protein ABID38_05865 [Candidatus Diapherotrites archaeon]